MVNGDLASLLLFGSLFVLSVAGPFSIDAKRRRAMGVKWAPFASATSAVPFVAIVQGRQTLELGEIGPVRLVAAVGVWAILLWAHPHLFGVSPLPR